MARANIWRLNTKCKWFYNIVMMDQVKIKKDHQSICKYMLVFFSVHTIANRWVLPLKLNLSIGYAEMLKCGLAYHFYNRFMEKEQSISSDYNNYIRH